MPEVILRVVMKVGVSLSLRNTVNGNHPDILLQRMTWAVSIRDDEPPLAGKKTLMELLRYLHLKMSKSSRPLPTLHPCRRLSIDPSRPADAAWGTNHALVQFAGV